MKFQRIVIYLVGLSSLLFFYGNCNAFRSISEGNFSSSAETKLRRLSNDEITKSLNIILEDTSLSSSTFLPKENRSPYDNEISMQNPSAPLIQGLDSLAADVSGRLVLDSARKLRVLGCNGTSSADATCMTNFVKKIGRLFFRRNLSQEETSSFVNFGLAQAGGAGSFDVGVEMVIRALVQHPSFLYRIENSVALSQHDIASRLSFFIWGSSPDDSLLRLAESGQLSTAAQIRAAANSLLGSPRAVSQIQKFHSLWFGYGGLPDDTLSAAMKREADAMVKRVLFDENKSWRELLLTNQTTIDSTLGPTYGMTNLGSNATLVNYPAGRGGILSTAAFLSVVPKFADTSPTMRGKFIRERLLCTPVPPPPPDANVDAPPPVPEGQPDCKYNRYDAHRKSGGTCFACHQLMDPIGFGLERFDNKGRYREYDYNADGSAKMTCYIEGKGDIPGMGIFSGPTELSQRLLESQQIQYCLVKQIYHFGMGEEIDGGNMTLINSLKSEFDKSGSIKDLILAVATSAPFLQK